MKYSTTATVLALAWASAAQAQPQPASPVAPAAAPVAPATPPAPAAETPAPAAPVAPPVASSAADTDAAATTAVAEKEKPLLGLGIGAPDTGSIPGRFHPSYGVPSRGPGDYEFDFHGYLKVPFRLGIGERENPYATQYRTVFHAPPRSPDEFERFYHTGNVPQPWVQLGFSYGNSRAVATIIIAARNVSNASGFFDPPTQLGINDAFVTFKPPVCGVDLEIDVGGFANRYGAMGEYDLGRYDTPVIARVGGVGETVRLSTPLQKDGLVFLAEHGVKGQFDRAPLGVEPAGWNGFADSNVGTSFAHHAHLGLALPKRGQLGVHYLSAFTRDDRTSPELPDGSITVLGADVRAQLAPFGRLYLGGAYTKADDARTVSGVIRVLNTFGGPGLMREYLGEDSGGNGSLTTFGAQYDVSIGAIVRDPEPFSGYGPDVHASVFTMYTRVGSDDRAFDDISKVKYGTEVTYSALPWLAFSGRYDRVVDDTSDDTRTLAVVSPRIILRTDYNSQDQVTIAYSRWFAGSGVVVREGYPAEDAPWLEPDENTFSITANMWW